MNRHAEAERDQIKRDHADARRDLKLESETITTTPPRIALKMLSSPNCFVETANWLSMGRASSESSRPVRTSSGMLETLTKKKAWNNCAMIWWVPTSRTTSHFDQSPMLVDLPEDDAEENDLAAEPEHFHDHPKNEIGLEAQLADERVAQHDPPDFKVTPHADDLFWRGVRLVNSAARSCVL